MPAGEFSSFWVSNGSDSHTGSILIPGLYSTVVTLPRTCWPVIGSQTVANELFFRDAKSAVRFVSVGLRTLLMWAVAPDALQARGALHKSSSLFQGAPEHG
jgi:hypothetical protein